MESGIYYFTLRERLPGGDWSGAQRFRVMIDANAPAPFQPQRVDIEGKQYLVFSATDGPSGVDRYEIAQQTGQWTKVESPYLLKDEQSRSIIQIRVIDKAGNERVAEFAPSQEVSVNDFILLLVFLIVLVSGVFLWRLRKRKI